jgi:hypothetical protein
MSSPPLRSTPPDRDRQGVARGIPDGHEPAAPDLEDSRLREVRGALVRGTAVSPGDRRPGRSAPWSCARWRYLGPLPDGPSRYRRYQPDERVRGAPRPGHQNRLDPRFPNLIPAKPDRNPLLAEWAARRSASSHVPFIPAGTSHKSTRREDPSDGHEDRCSHRRVHAGLLGQR